MSQERKRRILIVEDQVLVSMIIEDMIVDSGSEVVGPAAKLDHALTLALQADIDVGILDINVGGLVVFPVADVLRYRGIPFIFSTGYDAGALPMRFQGCPTLFKPFSYKNLIDMLQKVLPNSSETERA